MAEFGDRLSGLMSYRQTAANYLAQSQRDARERNQRHVARIQAVQAVSGKLALAVQNAGIPPNRILWQPNVSVRKRLLHKGNTTAIDSYDEYRGWTATERLTTNYPDSKSPSPPQYTAHGWLLSTDSRILSYRSYFNSAEPQIPNPLVARVEVIGVPAMNTRLADFEQFLAELISSYAGRIDIQPYLQM